MECNGPHYAVKEPVTDCEVTIVTTKHGKQNQDVVARRTGGNLGS